MNMYMHISMHRKGKTMNTKEYEAKKNEVNAAVNKRMNYLNSLQGQLSNTEQAISEYEAQLDAIKADGSLEEYTDISVKLDRAKAFKLIIKSRIDASKKPTEEETEVLKNLQAFITQTYRSQNAETLKAVENISKEITDLFSVKDAEAAKLYELYRDYASTFANIDGVGILSERKPSNEVLFKNFMIAADRLKRATEREEEKRFSGIDF